MGGTHALAITPRTANMALKHHNLVTITNQKSALSTKVIRTVNTPVCSVENIAHLPSPRVAHTTEYGANHCWTVAHSIKHCKHPTTHTYLYQPTQYEQSHGF